MSEVMTNHKKIIKSKAKSVVKSDVPNSFDQEPIFSFRTYPINQAYIYKLIKEMSIWLDNNTDSLFLTEFYRSKGITQDSMQKLLSRHPDLKQADQDAKRIMGERIYSRSVNGKANWQAARHRLWSYSDDFKKDEEFHSQLKANEKGNTDAPQVQYIVVDSKFDTNTDMKEISEETSKRE